MTYIICVPSYHRHQICNDKTLTTLFQHKINPKQIYVYVANKEEYAIYEKTLDKTKYNKIVVGKLGLVQQREFIEQQWASGKHLVFLDDDITKIDLSMSELFKSHSLDYFYKYAFAECVKHKAFIWGIYAVYNPFFRKTRPELTTSLNYIVGCFYGVINRPKYKPVKLEITITPTINGQKEDVERTIKYFISDGIVLRFNKVGVMTKYYGTEGGLGRFEDRIKPMKSASEALLKKYPNYGRIKIRKNGMYEFVLKKIPAHNHQLPPRHTLTAKAKRPTTIKRRNYTRRAH